MAVVVSLHAHPDDEALMTGGWLAQRAAAGDRVVLVFATGGEAGLAGGDTADLAGRRRAEGEASARALGVSRTVWLGYDDSGMAGESSTGSDRFVDTAADEVARDVAALLDEEDADVLTGYDANGGYGHPDHVHVHRVARAAQDIARRRPQLLEATRERDGLLRLVRIVRPFARWLPGITLPGPDIYVSRADLAALGGLRVDVRDQLAAKRAALRAHRSQAGGGIRTIALLLALPAPLARRVLGTECFLVVP
ncbi:MAG: PIG-L family deacetylase [Nocardioidaceae bacterium]|nr:PIG-L family deacetylase [Nocardioidaceae bacterium]MCL2612709.1 PIG-L family deacetylase [Nocardioidaceae bacterium]